MKSLKSDDKITMTIISTLMQVNVSTLKNEVLKICVIQFGKDFFTLIFTDNETCLLPEEELLEWKDTESVEDELFGQTICEKDCWKILLLKGH